MSGLSHIAAVSGWNVSVVVATTGALFRAFGARGWRWLIVQLILLAGYVWIVGLEPPIQRAAIMGAIALVALQLGRPAHILTLLTITAGIMAAWNPAIL
jgi:competence protein ComEC